MPVGFALLLAVFGPTAPVAEPLALTGPRLTRGEELVYVGEVRETGDRIGNRFKKRYDLEVRVFVLDSAAGFTDCGVLTTVQPLDDELVPGKQRVKAAPAVRIDLIRVDDRGRVKVLTPAVGPPPLPIDTKTPTAELPPLPLDAPPACELAAFIPLPVGAAKVGGTGDITELNRPPAVWSAKSEAVWNGRRCVELTATQQTDGYDLPDTVRHGWKRTETVLVSPADGYASVVSRTIVRREGRDQEGTLTVRYELQPATKHAGAKYTGTRAEVEAAWAFAAEHAALSASKPRPGELRARAADVDRYLSDRSTATPYRTAIEAVKRRYEGTSAPPVTVRKLVVNMVEDRGPTVGKPAPDFVAPDVDKPTGRVRLSAGRGKPTVVVFFKPGSATAVETLAVCEALHRKYADTLTVIPLAIHRPAIDAAKERSKWKLTVPVYDGADVREVYAVESFPQFFVVDGAGILRWAFDAGVGPEVGYLVKQEVEKLVK
jgi:hypothetical protein